MTLSALRKVAKPIADKVMGMVAIGVVKLITEGRGLQQLQLAVLADELVDDVERFQDYGLASYPKPGAEGVCLSLMGARGRMVVVAVGDRRYRLQGLAEGEVAIHDDQGQSVWLKRDRIKIASPTKIELDAPEILLGAGATKKVALHDDPVVSNKVVASSTKVKAV